MTGAGKRFRDENDKNASLEPLICVTHDVYIDDPQHAAFASSSTERVS